MNIRILGTIVVECRSCDCSHTAELDLTESVPLDELHDYATDEATAQLGWCNGYCPECAAPVERDWMGESKMAREL